MEGVLEMNHASSPDIQVLQRKCWLALNLYTDLAEACCDILIQAESGPLPPERYAKLTELRHQEHKALMEYLQARIRLSAALSVLVDPVDRGVWLALSASVSDRIMKQRSGA